MGCWAGTDALTQLAIHAGDSCRLIILLPYKWGTNMGGGYCYSSGLYEPFALPLKGKYNDYGCIDEIEEDANTQFIVRWFEESFQKGDIQFSERAHDLDKYDKIIPKEKKPSFTIQQIIEWMERGYLGLKVESLHSEMAFMHLKHHHEWMKKDLEVKTILSKKQVEDIEELNRNDYKMSVKFDFMLILEETYQTALKVGGGFTDSFYDHETSKCARQSYSKFIEKKLSDYRKSLEEQAESAKRLEKIQISGDSPEEKEAKAALAELRILTRAARSDMWSISEPNDFMREYISPYIQEMIVEGDNNKICKWLDLIGEYKNFVFFMECARKGFAPQAGAGSQSDTFEFQRALAKTTLKICGERLKERKKWDAENKAWELKYKKEQAAKAKKEKATAKKSKKTSV